MYSLLVTSLYNLCVCVYRCLPPCGCLFIKIHYQIIHVDTCLYIYTHTERDIVHIHTQQCYMFIIVIIMLRYLFIHALLFSQRILILQCSSCTYCMVVVFLCVYCQHLMCLHLLIVCSPFSFCLFVFYYSYFSSPPLLSLSVSFCVYLSEPRPCPPSLSPSLPPFLLPPPSPSLPLPPSPPLPLSLSPSPSLPIE